MRLRLPLLNGFAPHLTLRCLQCDKCQQKVDATKLFSIASLPEVLCLHLKRFSHNSYFGGKISQHVMFPLRDLNMAPFMSWYRVVLLCVGV